MHAVPHDKVEKSKEKFSETLDSLILERPNIILPHDDDKEEK